MANYPTIAQSYPAKELPPDYGTIATRMESGYIQTRARNTIAPRMYEIFHQTISGADVATFIAFWNSQKGGALSFNYTDLRTNTVVACKFDGATIPFIQRDGVDTYSIGPVKLIESL